MILWVDADATPRPVREIIFRASLRLELDTVLVANHRIGLPANNDHVRFILVEHGFDVADHHIATRASSGDVTLARSDDGIQSVIEFNYLDDDRDRQRLVGGVRRAIDILLSPEVRPLDREGQLAELKKLREETGL